jgi:hypothetical protein
MREIGDKSEPQQKLNESNRLNKLNEEEAFGPPRKNLRDSGTDEQGTVINADFAGGNQENEV